MTASHLKRIFAIALAVSLTTQQGVVAKSQQEENAQPVCDQQRALLLVKQQADEAKNLDQAVTRITILIRAASLLWPFERERARAIFTEAFELATEHFRQRGDETNLDRNILVLLPDERFRVVAAIARHDAAWAKQLAQSAAEESLRETEKNVQPTIATRKVGEHLIGTALELLNVDRQTAISFARSSLRHPASSILPMFLFELAKADRAAADGLFEEALAAYAQSDLDSLDHLSVYPFALPYSVSYVSPSTRYTSPPNFARNSKLQQAFLETLFARLELSLKLNSEEIQDSGAQPGYRPNLSNAYVALTRLEPLIAQHQPAYSERAASLKTSIGATLDAGQQADAADYLRQQRETEGENLFDRKFEQVEREADADKRDSLIAQIVLFVPGTQSLERIESLLEKVSDSKVQHQLRDWVYFKRAQRATKSGLFEEAARLAAKVEELDHRAFLSFENVSEIIKRLNDSARARELLDEVAAVALKAPNTIEKARTLLGVVHLLAKLDRLRASEVMSEAVKTINRLEQPDFNNSFIIRTIEGRGFSMFASYDMPGINLETALRELGATDFDGALYLSKNLEDKPLRATAALALSAPCLEKPRKQSIPAKPRQNRKKPQGKTEKTGTSGRERRV